VECEVHDIGRVILVGSLVGPLVSSLELMKDPERQLRVKV
jgi:hypothetical protein